MNKRQYQTTGIFSQEKDAMHHCFHGNTLETGWERPHENNLNGLFTNLDLYAKSNLTDREETEKRHTRTSSQRKPAKCPMVRFSCYERRSFIIILCHIIKKDTNKMSSNSLGLSVERTAPQWWREPMRKTFRECYLNCVCLQVQAKRANIFSPRYGKRPCGHRTPCLQVNSRKFDFFPFIYGFALVSM